MTKKLFALLLCAFATLGANATAKIENGVLYINGSSDAAFEHLSDLEGYSADETVTKIVMTGDFSSGWNSGWLINSGTNEPTEIATIDMSGATFGTGTWSFVSFNNLEEIIWPTNESLTIIPTYAFKNCSITSLTIPTSVKEIQTTAFDMSGLQTVTIPEGSKLEIIRSQAFNNCKSIRDVYVNVTPTAYSGTATDGTYGTINYIPWCEEQAFPYDITVQQTALENNSLATLHFDEEWFDFFCGNWKEGLIFSQANLDLIKSASSDGSSSGSRNGWQQFANTGSPRDILVVGSLLRTFSDVENFIAPTGIHVYRATAYAEASTGGTLTLTEITYKKGTERTETQFGIPGRTGVILKSGNDYVVSNNDNVSKFYLSDPETEDTFVPYPWQSEAGYNWLFPTLLGGDEVSSADWEGKTVTYRNFGFRTSSEDFRRLKKGKLAPHKAYLKLPAGITKSLAEVNDGPAANFSDTSAGAKIAIVFEDADLSQTTSLKNVDEIVENVHDNSYYTLEGVKVSSPLAKGVYVHNGKKVVVK